MDLGDSRSALQSNSETVDTYWYVRYRTQGSWMASSTKMNAPIDAWNVRGIHVFMCDNAPTFAI